jgi:hypothetical protein
MRSDRRRQSVVAVCAVLVLLCFAGGLAVASRAVPADTTPTSTESAVVETTTQEIEITTVVVTTVESPAATTTAGNQPNPGAVAVVGAKVSESQTDTSSTQWGWIAFAILAGAVAIFGIVLLLRSRKRPA